MKAALFGDVHADLPALEAVLAHAAQRGVDAFWHTGDLVAGGAFPDEVVRCVQAQENVLSVLGNGDLKVLRVKEKRAEWRRKTPAKWLALRWTYERLAKPSRRYLRELPLVARLETEGKRVLLAHGSPSSVKEALFPETPDERFRELAETSEADVIVCGHTHQAFARKVGGVWFINPGSVGQPADGDSRPCYAILHFKPRFFQVRYYRVGYDVAQAAARIRERGLSPALIRAALPGAGLDEAAEAS